MYADPVSGQAPNVDYYVYFAKNGFPSTIVSTTACGLDIFASVEGFTPVTVPNGATRTVLQLPEGDASYDIVVVAECGADCSPGIPPNTPPERVAYTKFTVTSGKVDPTPPTHKEEGGGTGWIVVLVISVVVLAAGGGVGYYLYRRRRRNRHEQQYNEFTYNDIQGGYSEMFDD